MTYTKAELRQCGIYRIVNTVNGKVYVGSTRRTFRVRWSTHRADLKSGRHGNRALQQDWVELGPDVFSFEILEVCERGISRDDLRLRELYYFQQLTNTLSRMHYSMSFPISSERIRKVA